MLSKLFKSFSRFVREEDGDAVTWIVLIIIGVIIALAAYVKFKGAPGDLGQGIQDAGSNAKKGLDEVRYDSN